MTDRLNVHDQEAPNAEITTQAQALGWMEELIQDMTWWRQECNVAFPGEPGKTAQHQRKALCIFLQKQGQVVGSLKTLRLVGLIPERAYTEMTQRAINTLVPDVVGRG